MTPPRVGQRPATSTRQRHGAAGARQGCRRCAMLRANLSACPLPPAEALVEILEARTGECNDAVLADAMACATPGGDATAMTPADVDHIVRNQANGHSPARRTRAADRCRGAWCSTAETRTGESARLGCSDLSRRAGVRGRRRRPCGADRARGAGPRASAGRPVESALARHRSARARRTESADLRRASDAARCGDRSDRVPLHRHSVGPALRIPRRLARPSGPALLRPDPCRAAHRRASHGRRRIPWPGLRSHDHPRRVELPQPVADHPRRHPGHSRGVVREGGSPEWSADRRHPSPAHPAAHRRPGDRPERALLRHGPADGKRPVFPRPRPAGNQRTELGATWSARPRTRSAEAPGCLSQPAGHWRSP
jgi:hypothetical protein